jgi:hypothetical protein
MVTDRHGRWYGLTGQAVRTDREGGKDRQDRRYGPTSRRYRPIVSVVRVDRASGPESGMTGQVVRTVHHSTTHTYRITLLQLSWGQDAVLGQFSTAFGLCGVDLCDPCWALKGSPPVPYFSHSGFI